MYNVSIIIPTYNRPQFLKRAIQSVLSQTYKDYEIIVVQNGPVEHSKALVDELIRNGAPIRYINEPRACPVNARNVGVLAAQGEYVAFLDDDDEWLPNKLEVQVAFLEKQENIGLVGCQMDMVDEWNQVVQSQKSHYDGEVSFRGLLLNGCFILSLSCVLVRKRCFKELGVLKVKYHIANDYELYLRLSKKYQIAYVPFPLVRYHRHNTNLSRNVARTYHEVIEVLKEISPEPKLGVSRHVLHRSLARYYYVLAADGVDRHDNRAAAINYFMALLFDPFVGLRIKWAKHSNITYRLLRPYIAMFFYGVLLITGFFLRNLLMKKAGSESFAKVEAL
ncbi:MAG: glycosyltransferase [Candidatus Omnitrophica bacterium]|nr:glycosyltransferase [Candidatus Omnitrophota bacterium]MDD5670474.1 glycosyltransferase [Candidatus Omnitrophota bacterium]